MTSPLDNFQRQAEACARLGSPFTAELCRLIPEAMGDTGFGGKIRGWQGDVGADAGTDALALRACGALHALVLRQMAPDLAGFYPPHPVDRAALCAMIADAIVAHDQFLTDYLDSPPQTNEVGRSAMILGAALHVARATGLPLSVMEIGASAGLNLWFNRYAYDFGNGLRWGGVVAPVSIASNWSGAAPPLDQKLDIVSRRGCDRNPLEPAGSEDQLQLLSYIWPDQRERLNRMREALDHAAGHDSPVDRGDAADWVERQLDIAPRPGTARMLYHTIVWQYLPEAVKTRIKDALERAGSEASEQTPLAWFSFESDQGAGGDGALMELTLWPGGEKRVLGRADFHGRWVRWE